MWGGLRLRGDGPGRGHVRVHGLREKPLSTSCGSANTGYVRYLPAHPALCHLAVNSVAPRWQSKPHMARNGIGPHPAAVQTRRRCTAGPVG